MIEESVLVELEVLSDGVRRGLLDVASGVRPSNRRTDSNMPSLVQEVADVELLRVVVDDPLVNPDVGVGVEGRLLVRTTFSNIEPDAANEFDCLLSHRAAPNTLSRMEARRRSP